MENLFLKELETIAQEERDRYKINFMPPADIIKHLSQDTEDHEQSRSHGELVVSDGESFNKPWGKLDKQQKSNRIMKYVQKIKNLYKPSQESLNQLKNMLLLAVENRQITRKTDVIYCPEEAEILRIENLKFDRGTGTFVFGDMPAIVRVTKTLTKKPTFDKSLLQSN